ncbi:MAG: hypothetical protein MK030_02155, partial [SAR116 cluster bacterium]|nr:hypothetical protein [SAR116 cluster bacterium]
MSTLHPLWQQALSDAHHPVTGGTGREWSKSAFRQAVHAPPAAMTRLGADLQPRYGCICFTAHHKVSTWRFWP